MQPVLHGMVDLAPSVLNLSALRDASQQALFDILDSARALAAGCVFPAPHASRCAHPQLPGRKALVLDSALAGPLAALVSTPVLKEKGVDELFYLDGDAPPSTDAPHVVYLLRPRAELAGPLASCVRSLVPPPARRGAPPAPLRPSVSQLALFQPCISAAVARLLEDAGVSGDVSCAPLPTHWQVVEPDLLVLAGDPLAPLRDAAAGAGLGGDGRGGAPSPLTAPFYVHSLAAALVSLQATTTGTIPLVRGKGHAARAVADSMLRLRREAHASRPRPSSPPPASRAGGATAFAPAAAAAAARRGPPPAPPGCVHPPLMVLLDRSVDWATVLCTQLTYEGLADELLGISNGAVALPAGFGGAEGGARKARLDSRDALFGELRDANFGAACDALRAKTAALAADYTALKGGGGSGGGGGGGGGGGASSSSLTSAASSSSAAAESRNVRELGGFVRRLRDNMGGAGADLHAGLARGLLDRSRTRPFGARLAAERAAVEGGREGADAAADAAEAACCGGGGRTAALRALCLACVTSGGAWGARGTRRVWPHDMPLCSVSLCLYAHIVARFRTTGLPAKRMDALRREAVHAFGPSTLLALDRLASVGLLQPLHGALPPPSPSSSASAQHAPPPPQAPSGAWGGFPAARAAMRLCSDGSAPPPDGGGDAAQPSSASSLLPASAAPPPAPATPPAPSPPPPPPGDTSFSYSHAGYSPLSVRLAAIASRPGGWRAPPLDRASEDALLRSLPGPTFELRQAEDAGGTPTELHSDSVNAEAIFSQAAAGCAPGRLPPVLVVFIGGVTRAEVSCLRALSKPAEKGGAGRTFVAIATGLISGDAVIAALAEDEP